MDDREINTAYDPNSDPDGLEIPSFLYMPLAFAYFEIVLKLTAGQPVFSESPYPLLFSASAGLLLAGLIAFLPHKAQKICTGAVLYITGLLFLTQCVIRSSFQFYMEFASIFAGLKGVVTGYTENLVNSVVNALPDFALFFAPGIIYTVLGKKLHISPRVRPEPLISVMFAVCGAAFCVICSVYAATGELKEIYKEQYEFDLATEKFGLITGMRLSLGHSAPSVSEEDDENLFEMGDMEQFNDFVPSYEEPAVTEAPYEEVSPVTVTSALLPEETEIAAQTSLLPLEEEEPGAGTVSAQLAAAPIFTDQPAGTAVAPFTEPVETSVPISETSGGAVTSVPVTSAVPISSPAPAAVSSVPVTEAAVTAPPQTEATTAFSAKPPVYKQVEGVNALDIDFASLPAPNARVASVNQYCAAVPASNKNAYTGLFAGKNLILICAEAFSDVVIDEKMTPTLYRLSHKGIYFSEYYQPTWGGSTSTGEYSFLTGLVPAHGVDSMYNIRNNNNYFTLGSQLDRLGYTSCAFHNGTHTFYNRDKTHFNLGYDNFLAFGNGLENYMRKFSDDTTMISTTVEMYLDKQPFSLYYMTVSGHSTYDSGNVKVSKYLPRVTEARGTRFKNKTNYYLCYQMELENALTVLVNQLEEAGIADDTVICLTSDHYPYGLEASKTFKNDQDYVTDLYGYKYSTPWEKDHNTWILWSGCLENELSDYACEISAPTYSLDIVPTLSNLFGLEYDSRLLVGRDVFSNMEAIVVWNSYSWATVRGKYNARNRQFYPNPGYEYDREYVDRICGVVKNKINLSGQIADNDYYRLVFGG